MKHYSNPSEGRVREIKVSFYSPIPIIIGVDVGAAEPASGSIVIAKVLASTPVGSGGLITAAVPCVFGLKIPAGMGAPLVGINHNS